MRADVLHMWLLNFDWWISHYICHSSKARVCLSYEKIVGWVFAVCLFGGFLWLFVWFWFCLLVRGLVLVCLVFVLFLFWGFGIFSFNPENKIMNFWQIMQLCFRHNFQAYSFSFSLIVLSVLAIVKLSLQQHCATPANFWNITWELFSAEKRAVDKWQKKKKQAVFIGDLKSFMRLW